ncbi:MAG: ABC transporter ATP-binding protein [Thermoprotei archaeon]
MNELVKFTDVWFTYLGNTEPSLKGINLSVDSGEFVLVTGPSGCGKSTLLRCMNGLIPHFHEGEFKGSVHVGKVDTRSSAVSKLAQRVGLVFPDPESQLIALEVEDDVAFGPGNLGLAKQEVLDRVDWALRKSGIEGLRHAQVFKLSGGEQQKVAIASILALKPSVLVLDEPTANLDPLSAKSLIDLLGELNRGGTTIIVAEHRLSMISKYCTRVLLMDDGKIVLDADPSTAFTSRLPLEIGVERPEFYMLRKSLLDRGLKVDDISTIEELLVAIQRKAIECDGA